MDFKEFETELLKKRGPKKMKITGSWGVYDAYKMIRKNKWFSIGRPLKTNEFYSIVRGINKLLADELALGNTVELPARMGKIELKKKQPKVRIVNGKLVVPYTINWKETNKLWYEDEEAFKNKILIRHEVPYIFTVHYDKYKAIYENKIFYDYEVNRFIKRKLKDNIIEGKTDTLW